MPRQYKLSNLCLLTSLIIANGCPSILGFQTNSNVRLGSLYSTRISTLSPSPTWSLFAHNEDPEEDAFGLSPTNMVSNILEYKDDGRPVDLKEVATETSVLKEKINDFLVKKSRPKKKPISLHSFVSSMSAMSALLLLLPTFHPGIDEFGFPRLFNYEYASNDLLWQSQMVALLQMVGSLMGIFRLPKNSPHVRTAGFVISALVITQLSLVTMSSLNGTDVYLFDAFSMQGRALISAVNTALLIGSFGSITEIIGDTEQKGWETVPNYSSRTAAFSAVFPFHVLMCITGNAVLPVLSDKASFLENALPFFEVFPGTQTLGYIATSLAVGLGSLFATLQFEKKMTSDEASFWNLFVIAFLTYDGVKFMYLLWAFPEKFPHSEYFASYTPHLQSLFHTNEVLVVGTVLSMLAGLHNLSKSNTLAFASVKQKNVEPLPVPLQAFNSTSELIVIEDHTTQVAIDLESSMMDDNN